MHLITNNPTKIDELRSLGIKVVDRVALAPTINPNNEKYLRTKITRMNHQLDLSIFPKDLSDHNNGAD